MESSQELKTLTAVARSSGPSELEAHSSYDKDQDQLARLGKKQVLKLYDDGNMGGRARWRAGGTDLRLSGGLRGYIGNILHFGRASFHGSYIRRSIPLGLNACPSVLTELPQLYNRYALCVIMNKELIVLGWLTVAGWQALVASGGFLCGTLIQGLIVLNHPGYVFERWHGTMLFWAVLLVAIFVNTIISSLLPKIEGVILILHVLGFFAVMIPLVYMAPHGSASDVFTIFLNEGGWSTQGLSFFVGLLGSVFSFLGTDGVIHMSEEIQNPSINVPRSMVTSITLNAFLGFGMLIAVLLCLGDIEDAIQTSTGYPFMEIFLQATNSVTGSTAMAAIITALGVCATIGFVASSSRMTWSFARDQGLPFWKQLSKVEPRSSIPLLSVAVTTVIACLLSLIIIASSTAFNDVISLTVSGLYASYFMCCSLLLWRRCTGAISLPPSSGPLTNTPAAPQTSAASDPQLTWGPWRIPGVFGVVVNAFACAYMIVIIFFSFWPPATPTTASTMNYSSLVLGAVMIFSVVYYLVWARRVYKGPIVEIVVDK
ncbi:hypothetical protein MMC22_001430 [Lobaria immixta]|nr:hypothetical protein [Lobaria immixta]